MTGPSALYEHWRASARNPNPTRADQGIAGPHNERAV